MKKTWLLRASHIHTGHFLQAEMQQTACMFATSVNFSLATKEEMMNNMHMTWANITLSVRLTGATQYGLNSRIFAVGIIRFLYTHRHAALKHLLKCSCSSELNLPNIIPWLITGASLGDEASTQEESSSLVQSKQAVHFLRKVSGPKSHV